MHVREAVTKQRSVRAFLADPVPLDVVAGVLEDARAAPTNANFQPQHVDVLAGEALEEFTSAMRERFHANPENDSPEHELFPKHGQWSERRFQLGVKLYGALGIERGDAAARRRFLERNLCFFGAPMGLLLSVDREGGPYQWADLGIYLQTVMLLLRGEGIDSCAQANWAEYGASVSALLGWPENRSLYCGVSVGYADPESPVNTLPRSREPLSEYVVFRTERLRPGASA